MNLRRPFGLSWSGGENNIKINFKQLISENKN